MKFEDYRRPANCICCWHVIVPSRQWWQSMVKGCWTINYVGSHINICDVSCPLVYHTSNPCLFLQAPPFNFIKFQPCIATSYLILNKQARGMITHLYNFWGNFGNFLTHQIHSITTYIHDLHDNVCPISRSSYICVLY